MKKASVFATTATLLVGAAVGLSLLSPARLALANGGSTPVTGTASTPAPAVANEPSYRASIQVPNVQDAQANDPGKSDTDQEAAESSQLASQAKTTPEQARSAALAAVPGQVTKVSLDNENGNLVYSVEITDASGVTADVKVDAGDGRVLAREQGEDKGESEKDKGAEKDTDSVQVEQEGEH